MKIIQKNSKSNNKKTNKNNTNNKINEIKKIIVESLKKKEEEISDLKSNINKLISKINDLEEENKILKKNIEEINNNSNPTTSISELQKEVEKIKSAHAAIVSIYNLKNNITEFVMKDIITQIYNTVTNHINNIDRDINEYLTHNKPSKSISDYLNSLNSLDLTNSNLLNDNSSLLNYAIVDTSMNNIFNQ
ncbi:9695_t:CDS:2 [Cetraspora pellucida]|uniref:9695_t:CDS:1 n=1 Tax=Cetraspora pellucida TaxID=1433469 RepID=A0A9N9JIS5_9GLOM|nr:9695_t:CDS:2 [Cetraspora pellucida]